MMKQTIKTMLALLALLVSSTGAWAQEKSYFLDEYGDSHDFYYSSYTALTSSGTGVTIGGDYYVEGDVTINGTVAMNANTSIILCDGATLTINGGSGKGIDDNTHHLAIFGQSSGSHAGKLVVSGATGAISCEIFAIYSGQVQATSTGGCGIEAKSVYLNNGHVTATGATNDIYANNGTGRVRIGNGKVTANGNDNNIYSMGEIIIEGGQVTANSGTSGISATNITLGWTNASDFILASNYTGTVRTAAGMPFNIEGGGTLAADADVDNATVAGKTLTPNTTVPVYTITINSITNGTVESNKNVAFAGERVVLTPTPAAGYYYYDMSCTDAGSNDVAITKNVGDYQITMPAANVTVTASFGDKVAKNTYTGTEYASLKNALDEVSTDETIKILTDISGEGSNTKDVGSKDITIDLNGKSVVFGSIDIMQNLTIKNGTLTIGKIYNASADNNYAITFDNATVTVNSVGGNALEWYANNLVLKNGSHVTIKEHLFLGGGSGPTVTIADINSWLELIDCTVSGYASKAVIEAAFAPYLQPGKTLIANGYTLNTVGFRTSWGVQLNHSFGANATVTFWDGGTTAPAADTFDPSTYTDANKKTLLDNSDNKDHWIIVRIVPKDGYWTDERLLMAMETGASLAPSKAPGLDLGQALTLLKADDGRHDGAGWYYYKLSKDHNVTNGYYNSTLDGFVVPKFDLSAGTLSTSTASTSEVTLTANAAGNWQTIIKLNKTSFEYNGQNQTSTFSNAGNKIVVTKDGTTAAEFTIGDYLNFKIKNTGTDPVTLVESMKNAGGYTGVVGTFANTIFTNSKDVPFAITKKALTVTAKPKTITYGDTPVNDGVTYTGFVDGENENTAGIFGTSALSYAYSYAQYGNVGNTYTITPSGLTAANYDITFVNGTLTVNQKEVGLNWGATTFTYNGTAQAPTCTATGLVNNDVINVTVTGTQTTTGNYTATASALTGDKAGNYKLPAANTQAFTINPKRVNDSNIADDKDNNITIVLTDIPTEGYTYDGTAKTPTITVKDGDTEIPSGEYTVTITNNTNAGTATVTITDKDGGNYNVSGTTTFTINKASTEIAIAVPTLDNLNVNDEIASGASLSPAAAGSLTYTSSNPSVAIVENGTIKALAAGTATITVSFAGNDNYSAAVSKTIAVTVSLNNASVSVDNGTNLELLVGGTHNIVTTTTPDGLTVTYTADASGVVSVDAAGKITALKEGNATITVSVGGDGVYTENSKTVNVHVTKVLTNPDINLGGFTVTGGYTYNGDTQKPTITVKDGETTIPADEYTVTIKDGDGNTVTDPKDAGTYTVVITDNDGGNYTVSGTTTFTINKATLTIIAADKEKEVGADDPTLTYTYEGLAAGDNITGNLTREAGEAVGSYAISKGTLTAGDNYDIDFTEATLTIYRTLSLFSGSNEWATYVAQENLAVPAGIKAYIVTSVNGNTIITKNISYIPADVPILLQRTDNTVGDVKAVAGTGTDDVSGNKLVGNATAATDIQIYKDYVLYNNQFVLAGVSSVGAGKAYLPATAISSPAGAPRFLTISNDSETMGIGSLTPTLSEGEGAWYTLDGHKLNGKPAKKGLYIKNGVKVVIK